MFTHPIQNIALLNFNIKRWNIHYFNSIIGRSKNSFRQIHSNFCISNIKSSNKFNITWLISTNI